MELRAIREMARGQDRSQVAALLQQAIQTPEQATEFLTLYYEDGPQPLAKQVKIGLSAALKKFTQEQRATIPFLLARDVPGRDSQ